jgi:hypothetical protein
MEEIKNSFITNVNILASISPTLENIGKNIVELKNISENNDTYNKIIILEDGILAIKNNISNLINITNSLNVINQVQSKLTDIEYMSKSMKEFNYKFDSASNLVSTFRTELDKFFMESPEIKKMYDEIILKNNSINKNVLIASSSATTVQSAVATVIAAQKVIEEKYEVYKNAITFKSSIEAIALNIEEIKDAISITNKNKSDTNANVQQTTEDKATIKIYKDETLANRNATLTYRDSTFKAISQVEAVVNQINQQTSTNSKLAFQVHSIATRLNIEFSKVITSIKNIQEEKENELNIFAENLTEKLNLEIANAKTVVSKDVVTSQKIVSEISQSLSLLSDSKNRENKNEIRFKNSELVSLLAVSKMMIENKLISDASQNQILEFETKLKGYEHEKIKSLLDKMTNNKRVELLVAKGLLTDIKLQNL